MKLPPGIAHFISRNDHASCYQSIKDYVQNNDIDIETNELHKAIETNELWTILWYPHTPVGFFQVAASTLDRALELANEKLDD